MPRLQLPDSKAQREEAIRRMRNEAALNRNPSQVEWYVAYHYLRGARDFEFLDYSRGVVVPDYVNTTELPFRYEELLKAYSTEVGRLMRLDVAPWVAKEPTGLDKVRDRAVAQSALDYIYPYLDMKRKYRAFCELLVAYGTAGLLEYEDDELKHRTNVEVIPPWQLLFLPGGVKTPEEVMTTARERWVHYDWVKQIFEDQVTSWPNKDDDKLQAIKRPAGQIAFSDISKQRGQRGSNSSAADAATTEHTDEAEDVFVRLTEYWTPYTNGRLARYNVYIGDREIVDQQYENDNDTPMNPIGVARYADGLGPYGRSFVSMSMPLNKEIEDALLNMLREVQDFNKYGMIGLPASWGVSREDLTAPAAGPRVFMFDEDPMETTKRDAIHVAPQTSGQLQSNVLQTGLSLLERITQQPAMITEGRVPGRVESTPAINYLYQANAVTLSHVATSIEGALTGIYKSVLFRAQKLDNIQLNFNSLRDDAIIGLQLDDRTGKINLTKNAVPDPTSLQIGIRSTAPQDPETKKNELFELLKAGIISQTQFKLTAKQEGIDLPLMNDSAWQNYRTAVLRNILLFNDGETPGALSDNELPSEFDNPEIQLMVIGRLIASPEFMLASDDVQNAVMELAERYRSALGSYPEQLPAPEEIPFAGQAGAPGTAGAPQGQGQAAGPAAQAMATAQQYAQNIQQ